MPCLREADTGASGGGGALLTNAETLRSISPGSSMGTWTVPATRLSELEYLKGDF